MTKKKRQNHLVHDFDGKDSLLFVVTISCNVAGIFPEPDKDPVIQIANMVIRQGEKDPFIRNVFTLKKCARIVGAEVLSFDRETELLKVKTMRTDGSFTLPETETDTAKMCAEPMDICIRLGLDSV